MSQIAVYARVRPSVTHFYKGLTISDKNLNVTFGVKAEEVPRYAEPHYREHTFQFQRVFNERSSQEEVYEIVAKHVVEEFLKGYNGTIFAYGQTASGKTYTMEGEGRQYSDRGLAPRIISEIYHSIKERESTEDIVVNISYMEIYQDTAYDLLNASSRCTATVSTLLPKVSVVDGPNGEVKFKNLSTHLAASEEVALQLLFEGSTCRKVAETVMNLSSSRSHSIFTMTLTAQPIGADVRTKSKLNLVDLAGSERVAKTGADGLVLQEAKYINLSLHHLEHVIVLLQKYSRTNRAPPTRSSTGFVSSSPSSSSRPNTGFIPYRNSLLTMVLKDSLGGNCVTAMIATVSPDRDNIRETVSTCRFSQRVACISNVAKCNEELDDKAVIRLLKKRIAELEGQLLAFQQIETPLSSNDKTFCHQVLYDYLHGKVDNPITAGINTCVKFQECLSVMKEVVLNALKSRKNSLLAPNQLSNDRPSNDRPSNDRPFNDRPSNDRPSNDRPFNDRPFNDRPSNDRPFNEKTVLFSNQHHQIKLKPNSSNENSFGSKPISPLCTVNQVSSRDSHQSTVYSISPNTSSFDSGCNSNQSRIVSSSTISQSASYQTTSNGSLNNDCIPYKESNSFSLSTIVKGANTREKSNEQCNIKKAVNISTRKSSSPPVSTKSTETVTNKSPNTLEQEKQLLMNKVVYLKLQIKKKELHNDMVQNQITGHVKELSPEQKLKEDLVDQQQLKLKQKKLPKKLSVTADHLEIANDKLQKSVSNNKSPIKKDIINLEWVKEEIQQLRLSQLEKELELKEANTRQRLAMLKQQLISEQKKQFPTDKKAHTYVNMHRNESVLTTHPPESQTKLTKDIPLTPSQETGEMHYTTALQKQKERVFRIRQCIKAAKVIQRTWRKYKNKKSIDLL